MINFREHDDNNNYIIDNNRNNVKNLIREKIQPPYT